MSDQVRDAAFSAALDREIEREEQAMSDARTQVPGQVEDPEIDEDTIDEPPPLSPRQTRALAELMSQPNTTEAAKAAGVGLTTLRRWMVEDENFVRHHQAAMREEFAATVQAVRHYMPKVTQQITDIFNNPKTPSLARLAAVRTLLNMSLRNANTQLVTAAIERARPAIEHDERMTQLEARHRPTSPKYPAPLPLSEKKQRAIAALIEQPTVTKAAEAACVGLRTLREWLARNTSFIAHHQSAQREFMHATMKSVRDRTPAMIQAVYEMTCSQARPVNVRIAAAKLLESYSRRAEALLQNSENTETRHQAALIQDEQRDIERQWDRERLAKKEVDAKSFSPG